MRAHLKYSICAVLLALCAMSARATTQHADEPEPMSLALLGLGLLCIWALRRRP